MFEFEVSAFRVDPAAIPESVKEAFEESRKSITSFSILPWEEHCIECAMPACYTTCNLYEPRKDGKCPALSARLRARRIPITDC